MNIAIIIIAAVIVAVWGFCYHQNKLKLRAHLMREAVRNEDFSFRLSLDGLFYGEKAMQEALNDFGQDINRMKARNEVESWQKLTRVLTHEIMNVTTPIQCISQAYLDNPSVHGTSLEKGILAINNASANLISFVDSYRKLTQLQECVRTSQNLQELVGRVTSIYPSVGIVTRIPSDLTVSIDESLMRQVLVNLVKNAIDAGATMIKFEWRNKKLLISNNGAPILPEVRNDIFIPFYTTKASGSGIGLALSRQIMNMQGGWLSLAEKAVGGYHVTFVIEFEQDRM